MDVLFYDRKNDKQVKASELMPINFIEVGLVVDSEEYRDGEWQQDKHPAYLKERKVGTLGYKSENCPSHCNWDMHCNQEDLIFLKVLD